MSRSPDKEEAQQSDRFVLARLVYTEQGEIGVQSRLIYVPVHPGPILGERFDGVLGVVVIPGNPVVIEESRNNSARDNSGTSP